MLQYTIALSTAEAEYMSIIKACKKVIWSKCLLSKLNNDLKITTVFCDNQSTFFSLNMFRDVCYHFMHNIMNKISSQDNPADNR